MSLAVVPPHRAPSIDPALRAFLAECLDGVGRRPIARGSGPAARAVLRRRGRGPLRDLRLARGRRRVSDERRRRRRRRRRGATRARVDHPARVLDIEETRATGFARRRLGSRPPRARVDRQAEQARRAGDAAPPRRTRRPGRIRRVLRSKLRPELRRDELPGGGGRPEGGSAATQPRVRRAEPPAQAAGARAPATEVRELERAAAHFQFVAQQAFAENVDLRRRLDGVAGEVAGSNPVVAAASVVTRLPIPRTAPMQSTTTRGRRTGAADVYGENRGEAPSGAPSSGRAGEPFGADDGGVYLMRYATRGVASTPRGSLAE